MLTLLLYTAEGYMYLAALTLGLISRGIALISRAVKINALTRKIMGS
jgi:hypothetical protein